MTRVGLLGGIFNPPHVGHLILAQEALAGLGLDAVVFVPAGRPPHREVEVDPGADARAEMCALAIAAHERFRLSRLEVDRDAPSYTVDTLRAFREESPDEEPVLVLGGDQAAALPDWHEPAEVARLAAGIGVAERSGGRRAEVAARVGTVPGAAEKLEFFDMPRVDVSSTLVRRRAGEGLPVRYLVPDRVAAYIGEHGLYGAPAAAPGAASASGSAR